CTYGPSTPTRTAPVATRRPARASATCTRRSSREPPRRPMPYPTEQAGCERAAPIGLLKGGPCGQRAISCSDGSQSWTAPTTVPPSRAAQLQRHLVAPRQEEETPSVHS